MTNVGALNYKVSSNVSGFKDGMVLSRSELAMTRRAFLDSRSDAEKLQYKLDTLEKAFKSGVGTEDQYNRAKAATLAKSKEGIAQAQQEAELMRQASEITRRMMTDEERLADERSRLINLRPHLAATAYARAMAELDARMPEAIQAEKDRADAIARTEAEQRRAQQIVSRLITDEERLANERRELESLKPHLSAEQYSRAMADLNSRMPEAIQAEQRLQREQQQLNEEMAEGRQLTQSLETATERYSREMQDLDRLLRRGAISQETYGRAVGKARGDLANNAGEIAQQIPMVGNLSASLLSGAARFGPYGAAAIAVGSTLYGFGQAVGYVSDQVSRQMEVMDQQHETASQLMVDLEAFQTLVFAGGKQSGANEDQIGAMLGKLQLNFAKAAQGNEKLRGTIQGLGLDVDQLAGKDATVIFREVSQAISEMKTPSDQMKAVFELAGKQGMTMLDTFRLGSGGIDEMNARARELNALVDEVEAEQIAAANDAWNEMKMAIDGVWNSLAVEFSPWMQMAAASLEEVVAIAGMFVRTLGLIPDAVMLITGTMMDWYEVAAGIATLDWDRIAGGLNSDATVGLFAAKDALVASNAMNAQIAKAKKDQQRADAAWIEANAEKSPAELAAKAADSVNEEIEALRKKNLELAMGKEWAEQYRIMNLNVPPALKEELLLVQARNKELERTKKLEEESAKAKKEAEDRAKREKDQLKSKADQLAESVKSPFEKVVDEIADIRKLRSVGAIDERTARQAEIAARKRLTEGERKDVPASAPTANRGTREAYQLIVENAKAERDAVDARHKEQMAELAIANTLAERTAIATERMQPVGGV